jgi:hypothetical protein
MNPSIAIHSRSSHPLSGLEAWPKTGPVYGFADDEAPRAPSIWERLSQRLQRAPVGEPSHLPQARIWY